jgi:hypothetical protein
MPKQTQYDNRKHPEKSHRKSRLMIDFFLPNSVWNFSRSLLPHRIALFNASLY